MKIRLSLYSMLGQVKAISITVELLSIIDLRLKIFWFYLFAEIQPCSTAIPAEGRSAGL